MSLDPPSLRSGSEWLLCLRRKFWKKMRWRYHPTSSAISLIRCCSGIHISGLISMLSLRRPCVNLNKPQWYMMWELVYRPLQSEKERLEA